MLILVAALLVAAPDLVVVQTLSSEGFVKSYTVNGFDAELMPSTRPAMDEHTITGFTDAMDEYFPVHPYFVRSGSNAIAMSVKLDTSLVAREDKGPWKPRFRVVALPGDDQAKARTLVERQGAETTAAHNGKASRVEGTFTLPDTFPAWGWTRAATVKAADKASLYAAYESLWRTLNELPQAALEARSATVTTLRTSTADFIRASESRGKKYTFIDELVDAASRLGFAEDAGAQAAKARARTRAPTAADLEPVTDRPSFTGPEVGPHLTLRPLPAAATMRLVVFADGHLAKLVAEGGAPPFALISNWHDGNWGAQGNPRVTCEAWFRKNASGAWELDALYSTHMAGVSSMSSTLTSLLQYAPF